MNAFRQSSLLATARALSGWPSNWRFPSSPPRPCYRHHSLVPKDPLINTVWPDKSMTAAIAKMKHFCCCCYWYGFSFPISGHLTPRVQRICITHRLRLLRESGRVRWRAPPLQAEPKCMQTAMDATCGMSPAEAGSLGLEAASILLVARQSWVSIIEQEQQRRCPSNLPT